MCIRNRLWIFLLLVSICVFLSKTTYAAGQHSVSNDSAVILSEKEFLNLSLYDHRFTIDIPNRQIHYYFPDTNLLVKTDYNQEKIIVTDTLHVLGDLPMNLRYVEKEHALLMWDAGGGRVFHYDFGAGELERLDKSYSFRAFYGHAEQVFDSDYQIYAYGGYGEFTMKDVLIYYNQTNQEWVDIPDYGDIPNTSYYGDFEYDSEHDVLLYFEYREDQIAVYDLDMRSWEWTRFGLFDVAYNSYRLELFSGINRYDPSLGLAHLYGEYFYDTRENVVRKYLLREGRFTQIQPSGKIAFDPYENEWLAFSRLKEDTKKIVVHPFSLDSTSSGPRDYVIIEANSEQSPMLGYMLAIFGLVVFIIMAILYGVRNARASDKKGNRLKTHVEVQSSQVIVHFGDRSVVFSEELDRKFWEYVTQLYTAGIQSCDLKEFDQNVLPSLSNESQYSTSRKKLLDHINTKLGVVFVEVKRSELDRRYRKIVFDHSIFTQ